MFTDLKEIAKLNNCLDSLDPNVETRNKKTNYYKKQTINKISLLTSTYQFVKIIRKNKKN